MNGRETVIISGGLESIDIKEQWGHDYRRHQRFGWLSDWLWAALERLGCVPPHMGVVKQWRFEGHVKAPKVLEAIHNAVNIEQVLSRAGQVGRGHGRR